MENKNDIKKICDWCEDNIATESINGYINLCDKCYEDYDDTTGYCSLSCCMGCGCDGSC